MYTSEQNCFQRQGMILVSVLTSKGSGTMTVAEVAYIHVHIVFGNAQSFCAVVNQCTPASAVNGQSRE